jgi:hypothetical protein
MFVSRLPRARNNALTGTLGTRTKEAMQNERVISHRRAWTFILPLGVQTNRYFVLSEIK